MVALKIRKFGNSLGAIFPQAALEELHVGEGDTVYLTTSSEGVRVTPYSPDFEEQMKVAESVMRQDRNMLRELAKK